MIKIMKISCKYNVAVNVLIFIRKMDDVYFNINILCFSISIF